MVEQRENIKKKMVGRRFQVLHDDSNFDLEYDTDDGFQVMPPLSTKPFSLSLTLNSHFFIHCLLQVFQFQLYSLTSVPPHQQKVLNLIPLSLSISVPCHAMPYPCLYNFISFHLYIYSQVFLINSPSIDKI